MSHGPHHPPDVGRPGRHVSGADVLVVETVHCTLEGSQVGPRYGLRVAGGAGGEQDVGCPIGVAGDRFKGVVAGEKIEPGDVSVAKPGFV